MIDECWYCSTQISNDEHGIWVDNSGGDVCEDELLHTPASLVDLAEPTPGTVASGFARCHHCDERIVSAPEGCDSDWEHVNTGMAACVSSAISPGVKAPSAAGGFTARATGR